MQRNRLHALRACLVLAAVCTTGCASQYGTRLPSIQNEPVADLGTRCQLANRDILVRTSMPGMRSRCAPWADRQTAVNGL